MLNYNPYMGRVEAAIMFVLFMAMGVFFAGIYHYTIPIVFDLVRGLAVEQGVHYINDTLNSIQLAGDILIFVACCFVGVIWFALQSHKREHETYEEYPVNRY